jgi:hypothetical protein
MKRMKKLAIVLVVALLFSMFVLPISASAAPQTADEATVTSCQAKVLYAMVDTANIAIAAAVRVAQLTPYNDVDRLIKTVDAIADVVMAYADAIGAEVACEYTEYVIDGQKVLIDPLRVINIPAGNGNGGGNNTLD